MARPHQRHRARGCLPPSRRSWRRRPSRLWCLCPLEGGVAGCSCRCRPPRPRRFLGVRVGEAQRNEARSVAGLPQTTGLSRLDSRSHKNSAEELATSFASSVLACRSHKNSASFPAVGGLADIHFPAAAAASTVSALFLPSPWHLAATFSGPLVGSAEMASVLRELLEQQQKQALQLQQLSTKLGAQRGWSQPSPRRQRRTPQAPAATTPPRTPPQFLCRDFQRGECHRTACRFAHTSSTVQRTSQAKRELEPTSQRSAERSSRRREARFTSGQSTPAPAPLPPAKRPVSARRASSPAPGASVPLLPSPAVPLKDRIAKGIVEASRLPYLPGLKLHIRTLQMMADFEKALGLVVVDHAQFLEQQHRRRSAVETTPLFVCPSCTFQHTSAVTATQHMLERHGDNKAPLSLVPSLLRGLPNLGATCALSAVVAVLAASSPLADFQDSVLRQAIAAPSPTSAAALAAAIGMSVSSPATVGFCFAQLARYLPGSTGWRRSTCLQCPQCGMQAGGSSAHLSVLPVASSVPFELADLDAMLLPRRAAASDVCGGSADNEHTPTQVASITSWRPGDVAIVGIAGAQPSDHPPGLSTVPTEITLLGSRYALVAVVAFATPHHVIALSRRGASWFAIDGSAVERRSLVDPGSVCVAVLRLVPAVTSADENLDDEADECPEAAPCFVAPHFPQLFVGPPVSGPKRGSLPHPGGGTFEPLARASSLWRCSGCGGQFPLGDRCYACDAGEHDEEDAPPAVLAPRKKKSHTARIEPSGTGDVSATAPRAPPVASQSPGSIPLFPASDASASGAPLLSAGDDEPIFQRWARTHPPLCDTSGSSSAECSVAVSSSSSSSDEEDVLFPPSAHASISVPPPAQPASAAATSSQPAGRQCTCPRAGSGTQGRHRAGCQLSRQAARLRTIPIAVANSQLLPESAPVDDDPAWSPPIPYAVLAALDVPLFSSVPRGARFAVSAALAAAAIGSGEASFWRVLAFAKLVLAVPVLSRGGASLRTKVLLRRAALFGTGHFVCLLDEAKLCARVPDPESASTVSWPVVDLSPGLILDTDVDPALVPPSVVSRAAALARQGFVGRAAACLRCATVAPFDDATAAALRLLHPASDFRGPEIAPNLPTIDTPSAATAVRLLRSFPRGSTGGQFGLSPQHLLELCCVPGSVLPDTVARLVALVANGLVPKGARPYIFSAHLSAFTKKAGGIRPIAAGEVLRRAAAKLLCRAVSKDAGRLLQQMAQVAVGVSGGLDGAQHNARRFAAAVLESEGGCDELAVLKLDLSNAFNLVSRQTLLAEATELLPILGRYACAAYSAPSPLFFGPFHVLSSESGVQQGDPLGPLLFCLVLRKFWRLHAPDVPLPFKAWYADDGCLGAAPASLRAVVDAFTLHGPEFGLQINEEKCEVVTRTGAPLAELPGVTHVASLADWSLLGAPCGGDAQRERVSRTVAASLARKLRLLARVAAEDLQMAFVLLRCCGAFPSLVFFLRAMGPWPAWEDVDKALDSVVGALLGADGAACAQVSLPLSRGGLGLRASVPFGPVACIAAICRAKELALLFTSRCFPPDALLLASLASPVLAQFPLALQQALELAGPCQHAGVGGADVVQVRLQAKLSSSIDGELAARVRAGLDPRGIARVAAAANGTNLWLLCPPDTSNLLVLSSPAFRALARFRLGLPVTDVPRPCQFCLRVDADVLGDHSLSCMAGGVRTLAHNALRDKLFQLATSALLSPQREVSVFPASSSQRIDLVVRGGFGHRTALFDIAITHALTPGGLRAPGEAASRYEAVKTAEYGRFVDVNTQLFFPAVVDTFGGWGDSVRPALNVLAHNFASRCAEGKGGRSVFFAALNGTLMRSIAALLLANSPPPDGAE